MWTVAAVYSPIDSPVDQWQSYPLPPVTGVLNYGFRAVIAAAIPLTWQTLGFWAIYYTVDGEEAVTEARSVLLYPGLTPQPIRALGGAEVSLAGGDVTSLDLLISFNSWVPVLGVEILTLT